LGRERLRDYDTYPFDLDRVATPGAEVCVVDWWRWMDVTCHRQMGPATCFRGPRPVRPHTLVRERDLGCG
jgi:hypothetical protein